MLNAATTINCKGRILHLDKPIVMGVLNVTPDSFYDGGRYVSEKEVLKQAELMLMEGATFIDVGGMSSKPGAEVIPEEEELSRVIGVIELIHRKFPEALLSIDTVRAKVAREAIAAGASMVNDISAGGIDDQLFHTVRDLKVPYVLMHMQNLPKSMQIKPNYSDVVAEILDFLILKVNELKELGVVDVLIDPGFGFGKTVANNYELLNKLHVFKILEVPILVGLSRKSMIYKVLETTPDKALNGTTALHMVALQQGAKVLRVHDVKPAIETIELFLALEEAK